jgi:hypothetical protein
MSKKNTVKKIINTNYKKYLPSRKVSLLILAVIFSFIGVLLIRNSVGVSYNTNKLGVVTVGGVVTLDTDSDGITDWEERLWGTNPRDADSDDDGIPDGTEVVQERDRLALENGLGDNTRPLSETDKFARELFATYNALSEKGTVNEKAATEIAAATVNKMSSQLPKTQLVYTSDLRIVPTTEQSMGVYKERLAKLIMARSDFGADFGLIVSGVTSNNGDLLRSARRYTEYYTELKIGLLKTSVPESQVQNHVRLINNISNIAAALPQIDTVVEDIVLGVPLYTLYTESYEDMLLVFDAVVKQK